MQSVKEAGYDIIGKKMTLLGARRGRYLRSLAWQAALDGVKEISVFLRKTSRFYQRAEKTAEALMEQTAAKIRLCDFSDQKLLKSELADSAILTNATPSAMAPNENACPIPEPSFLPDGLIVSDIIYNPSETALLKMAKSRNLARL